MAPDTISMIVSKIGDLEEAMCSRIDELTGHIQRLYDNSSSIKREIADTNRTQAVVCNRVETLETENKELKDSVDTLKATVHGLKVRFNIVWAALAIVGGVLLREWLLKGGTP